MKKYINKTLSGVAMFLCFLALICVIPITCKARGASGEITDFNYFLASHGPITKIVFLPKTVVTPYQNLAKTSIGTNVDAYYDERTGSVYIYSTADKITLDSVHRLFEDMKYLEKVDFGNGRVVLGSSANSALGMFRRCKKLKYVNFNGLNMSGVKSMADMFEGCESLESLDLGDFNTSHVSDMGYMFSRCRSLKKLDISSFDTSGVTNMGYMFSQCNSLESLDLSGFDTRSVMNLNCMFEACESLQTLDLSSFNVQGAKYMFHMFGGCLGLKYINLSSFDMSNVSNAVDMFRGCVFLATIDAPKNAPEGLKLVGEFVIDNNRDGLPDTDKRYKEIPVSKISNHMITGSENVTVDASNGFIKADVGNVEYHIYPDGRVVAAKITATGSVKIDMVNVSGADYNVTEIGAAACKGNSGIKSLTISSNVTRIGKEAFGGCKNLKKVTINANKQLKVEKKAFRKINKKAVIKIKTLKGKAKKKLVKAIKKQTNAVVK